MHGNPVFWEQVVLHWIWHTKGHQSDGDPVTRVLLTQGEIFRVQKSSLHPCPDICPFLPSGCVKKPLQSTRGWALCCQVSAHTHITSSTDPRCKAGSHTVTPWHGLTLCPLHCPCAFWLAITCKDFPWKDHMFQSYVFPYTPLPGFLSSHSIWRMGRWQQCSVGKTLQTIVTGISKELPFLCCCYNTAKGSFFKGFPTEGTVERIHKGEKRFLCVLLANCWQWNVLCPWEVFLTCGCVEGKREFPAEN